MLAEILKSNGQVLRRNTFFHARREEFDTEECIKARAEFKVAVSQRLGDMMNMEELKPEYDIVTVTSEYKVYDDDDSKAIPTVEINDIVGTDKYNPDIYDGYITAQVILPRGDEF
jgi:hypothetical protein